MKRIIVLALFTLSSHLTFAKTDPDFSQPIELTGDFLSLNLNSKVGEYKGNFLAKQGSMTIQGNSIKMTQKENKQLDRIIASGQPVKFSKKNYQNNELISGSASKITYDANKLVITLEGKAEILTSGGRSFRSEILYYGLTTGDIKAIGSSERRVKIVIPANSTSESVPLEQF